MGDAAAYAKRVLLTCNGGDDDAVSRGIATSLARHGCRYLHRPPRRRSPRPIVRF
jgi:hypothetical protein